MRKALAALSVVLTFACVPAGAVAQSAGDEQYVDPFGGGEGGGGQEQPSQQEQPAQQEQQEQPAEPVEPAPSVPSEGGNGEAAGVVAPEASGPTLPRTGAPIVLLAAIGYGLLVAGIAIRRKA